jgi:ATP-dependent DNA ligase
MIYQTLYKRSVTGKVSTWYAEVENNCFRTVSGFSDGQKVTSEWTCCEAKNLNKSNATTAEQQAVAEVEAMYRKRQDLGYWNDVSKIDTPIYFKPMLAHDYNDYKDKIKFPIYSQPKLDGVRCIVRSDGMWSRNGKQIISAPHIFEALKPLFVTDPDLILDGELYADKAITDFNTIISCVRKTKPTAADLKTSAECIEYHIYDVPSHDGLFINRYHSLLELSLPSCCIKVATSIVNDKKEVDEIYSNYISNGYEGQMLRTNAVYEGKRSKSLLKHKSFVDADFTILGVVEGKGNLTGKVGKLQFEINSKSFESAVNGTWEYLTELYSRNDLVGKTATVKYFELTEDGVPRFPKVVEIRDYE